MNLCIIERTAEKLAGSSCDYTTILYRLENVDEMRVRSVELNVHRAPTILVTMVAGEVGDGGGR